MKRILCMRAGRRSMTKVPQRVLFLLLLSVVMDGRCQVMAFSIPSNSMTLSSSSSQFLKGHHCYSKISVTTLQPPPPQPKRSSPLVCFALSSLDDNRSSSSFSDDNDESKPHHKSSNETPQSDDSPVTELDVDAVVAAAAAAVAASSTNSILPGFKLRRLKDMMWVRETLEDLTAAEFACTVETTPPLSSSADDVEDVKPKRRRKRAVDYEKLLNQLNRRIRDLGCDSTVISSSNDATDAASFQCVLEAGVGKGSLTYTEVQRAALLDRLVQTRLQLIQVIHGNKIDIVNSENIPFLQQAQMLQIPSLPPLPSIPKEDVEDALSPKLYVRDDGTVDWDGALTSGAALRQFGTAVWARINGRDSDSVAESGHEAPAATATAGTKSKDAKNGNGGHKNFVKPVTARIVETQEIIDARVQLEALSKELVDMEKEHYKLLNSVISQGQATANIRLAMLDSPVRSRIQASAAALDNVKVRVSFQTLVYEMERIYTYLVGELGNPALNGYIPLQDRLNVAEFGLLESQVDSFNRQFMDNESVDEDVLAVIFEQLTDFKRRLGIDYYVAGLSFDREAIGRWLGELWVKTKNGLAFYVKGVRLFWNDVVFCLKLINRAAQGYTLKPREVRTIRRTFKDIITFIPFVIILIIPLSPIGHVLVFGAIQRFFPDFFPSCFTEQRQNLLQLYETTEYSELVINETWREKLSRFTEAVIYITANTLKTMFNKVMGFRRSDASADGESSGSDESSSPKKQ